MKLATLAIDNPRSREEELDGRLVVVSPDLKSASFVSDERCLTMRRALDNWDQIEKLLRARADEIQNLGKGEIDLSTAKFLSPLPRATDFVDGSSYLSHIERVRKARGAEPPEDMRTNPLMYRGIPAFAAPQMPIKVVDFAHGVDCEAEIAVIVGDVPAAAGEDEALRSIRLVTQINDVSLRKLIPAELAKQFGFLQSKPPSTAGPIAVTPDELRDRWNEGRPKLMMRIERNDQIIGSLDTSELHFSIPRLIAHAARTHALGSGTVVGTGTIANIDSSRGVACIAERVALDMIEKKEAITPFFGEGETVSIETSIDGVSLFGRIVNTFSR